MTTLDGQERPLAAGDLLICDASRPVALAGIMGGQDSEVAPDTARVLLEAAAFDPVRVRRTARRIGLHSEASQRFERGVDPDGAERASVRAARLLAQLGGGRVASGAVDAYPRRPAPRHVSLRASRASALCGVPITREVAAQTLGRLGLEVRHGKDEDTLDVTCPSFRSDLGREVDLIEEVLRLYGYDKIPATLPPLASAPLGQTDLRPEVVRRALTGLGLTEAITFGFTSPEKIRALRLVAGDRRLGMVTLQNPMSVDQSVMRTSLLPNLLAALGRNLTHGVSDVQLFELGSVFLSRGVAELPDEPGRLAGVLCGQRSGWLGGGGEVDGFDARGAVERVLAELGGEEAARGARVRAVSDVPYLHPGVAGRVELADGTAVGELGEVHPEVRAAFGIEPRCFVFDLDLAALPAPAPRQMRPVPRYPAVIRDISLFVAADLAAADVGDLIAARRDPLIERVRVLEEYRDPARVPPGQKGLLWSITYRSSEKTLTDAEVDTRHEELVSHLVEKLAATRR